MLQEELEDAKWIIRIHKSKDREHNVQKIDKGQTTICKTPNTTQNTKDRANKH